MVDLVVSLCDVLLRPEEWAIPECDWKPGGWLSVDSIADHRGGDAWTLRLTAVAFSWNPRSSDGLQALRAAENLNDCQREPSTSRSGWI
jgi:hypothetical protein